MQPSCFSAQEKQQITRQGKTTGAFATCTRDYLLFVILY